MLKTDCFTKIHRITKSELENNNTGISIVQYWWEYNEVPWEYSLRVYMKSGTFYVDKAMKKITKLQT